MRKMREDKYELLKLKFNMVTAHVKVYCNVGIKSRCDTPFFMARLEGSLVAFCIAVR